MVLVFPSYQPVILTSSHPLANPPS